MIILTPTQKRFAEWPLLIFLVMLVQSLELSLFHQLPGLMRPVHVAPILIAYLALTRDWGMTFVLSAILSYMGASTVGYSTGVYMASQIWVALGIKVIVSILALEGRRSFTLLALGGNALHKILVAVLLGLRGEALPPSAILAELLTTSIVTTAIAWFLFPLFIQWDRYFEHEREEASAFSADLK